MRGRRRVRGPSARPGYDLAVRSAVLAVWRRCCAVPVLEQDALLYLASALFALCTAFVAISADYRQWGQMAAVAYVAGAAICLAVSRRARRRGIAAERIGWTRRLVVLVLVVGAVLLPLFAQLTWRAEARPGAHAQPEVAVVERAGDRAVHAQDPYLRNPRSVGVPPSSDSPSVDQSSFFPYLPGMVPFGLLNAVGGPPELRDARVALGGFTLVVGAIALLASDATLGRRGRALQFLVVLPSGALPMVTGGDDLPVLALMLLGLVLAQRRRAVLAGLAMGCAGTLKFTAWPLLLLLLLSVRDREGNRAPLRYGLAVLIIVVPVIGAGIVLDPSAFFENVVRFPLGLARVKSPAASPLLGQVLVTVFPRDKTLITALLVLVGVAIVIVALVRHPPRTVAGAARFTAFAMLVATVLAPATRFGYLIYPANLFVWAYVLDGMRPAGAAAVSDEDQLASSISNTVRTSELVGAVSLPPPSAGVMDGFTGSMVTPSSQ